MSPIPGSSGYPVAQRWTAGLRLQLSHCTNTAQDCAQGTGRLSKSTEGEDQHWLCPSSPNTNPLTASTQFRWPDPCPAHTATTDFPPNPSRQQPVTLHIDVHTSVSKMGKICPRKLMSPLTFLAVSGSALLGALASKKLRLLATPSEVSIRLFWTVREDLTEPERCKRGRAISRGCAHPRGAEHTSQSAPSLTFSSSRGCPAEPCSIPMTLSKVLLLKPRG